MIVDRSTVQDGLLRHIREHFQRQEVKLFSWELGPISNVIPGFRVVRVSPNSDSDPWLYISMGAWQIEKTKGMRSEFFILSPNESVRHIETLAMAANFHADPKHELTIGKIVDIGQPWLEGSSMHHLMASLPYPYGPLFEWCPIEPATKIRLAWLLPIGESEVQYADAFGVDSLESRFDEAGIDFLNPKRPSVV